MTASAVPPVVDAGTWQRQLDALRAGVKAATRELDAIAAQRRRLPMVKRSGCRAGAPGERKVVTKRFKTSWRPLQKMAAWLAELGVTDAAMQSTRGVLAAGLPRPGWCRDRGVRGHAAHMRNVPGRKSDLKDGQWIAELHEHGLLRTGFIPATEIAALRACARYRKRLIEQRTAEGQRLAKVLEDAGIKTGLGGQQAAGQVRAGDDRGR